MAHDVFLSYSRQDSAVMERVETALNAAGLTIWTDQGIQPGSPSWKTAIEQGIRDARCIVVLFSPHAAESRWVRSELDFAEAQGKQIYPVLVSGDEKSAVPFGFTTYQWIDLRDQHNFQQDMARLITAIRSGEAAPAPAPPSVDAKHSSGSSSRRTLISGAMALVAVIALALFVLSLSNARQPPPTPTITPVPTLAGGASSVSAVVGMLAPEDVPEGWQTLEVDNLQIALPSDWITYYDLNPIIEMFTLMLDGLDVDMTGFLDADVTKIISSDLVEVQGIALSVDTLGLPMTAELLDMRMHRLFETTGLMEFATLEPLETVEFPIGSPLRYRMNIDPSVAETRGIAYTLQHELKMYLLMFIYRTADEEEALVLADQIARTWRITE